MSAGLLLLPHTLIIVLCLQGTFNPVRVDEPITAMSLLHVSWRTAPDVQSKLCHKTIPPNEDGPSHPSLSFVAGSGKTAAFSLPILERLLYRNKRMAATYALVLTPTRELAVQANAPPSISLHVCHITSPPWVQDC